MYPRILGWKHLTKTLHVGISSNLSPGTKWNSVKCLLKWQEQDSLYLCMSVCAGLSVIWTAGRRWSMDIKMNQVASNLNHQRHPQTPYSSSFIHSECRVRKFRLSESRKRLLNIYITINSLKWHLIPTSSCLSISASIHMIKMIERSRQIKIYRK